MATTNSSRTGIPASASGPITASALTMDTARLLGRTTAGTGAIEEMTVGAGLSLAAGTLTATARTLLAADKTLYVRTPAATVTFTNASANVGWPTHGLSVNDPVVLSIVANMGAATVTLASPGVFTKVAHGYVAGQPLRIDTTGTLPTGLTAGGTVYVIAAGLAADNFEVSLTPGGAAINTSGSQSGTHYVSQVGAMPTFSTAGLLVAGTVYYVKTVVNPNAITLSSTAGGTALGTATVATGSPIYSASTGNDANDGTAADRAHALLTINKAAQTAASTLDLQDYRLTVKSANTTYLGAQNLLPLVGGKTLTIFGQVYGEASLIGDVSTPEAASNVIIASQPGDAAVFNVTGLWEVDGISYSNVGGDDYTYMVNLNGNSRLALQSAAFLGAANKSGINIAEGSELYTWYNGSTQGGIAGPAHQYACGDLFIFTFINDAALYDFEGELFGALNAPAWGSQFVYGAAQARFIFSPGILDSVATGASLGTGSFAFVSAPAGLPGNSLNSGISPGTIYNGNLFGTQTNDNAPAAFVGEFASSYIASGAAVVLTDTTPANVTHLDLTSGDWDLEGNINFAGTAATITAGVGGIDATSATIPTDGSEVHDGTLTTVASDVSGITLPRKRISIASTTTIYLVAQKTFSAGTVAAYGGITARRVR